jgi:hypothetical protein
MSDTSSVPGGLPPAPPNSYNPIMHSAVVPGTAVAASAAADDTAVLANEAAAATRQYLGLTLQGGSAGQRVATRYAGPITLSEDEWDAVAGTSGGLARNTWYYVSAATAGKITATPNAAGAIGFALSSRTLFIKPQNAAPTS